MVSFGAFAHKTVGAWGDLEKCVTLKRGSSAKYFLSEAVFEFSISIGADWEAILSTNNQKIVMRACQFFGALHTGNTADFDHTYANTLRAARKAGKYDLARDAMQCITSGSISPTVETRGVSLRSDKVALHGVGTVPTKLSGCTGKTNGLFQVLGMTYTAPERNATIALNHDHVAVKRFFHIIDNASAAQLAALDSK